VAAKHSVELKDSGHISVYQRHAPPTDFDWWLNALNKLLKTIYRFNGLGNPMLVMGILRFCEDFN
jgi:hypothetical protein